MRIERLGEDALIAQPEPVVEALLQLLRLPGQRHPFVLPVVPAQQLGQMDFGAIGQRLYDGGGDGIGNLSSVRIHDGLARVLPRLVLQPLLERRVYS